tara:strand:- start:4426 stop:4713 length:288 start_codon:yes stop_codon:yes gene_type:complete
MYYKARLVEDKIKYIINYNLHKSHINKLNINNIIFNLLSLIFIISLISGILYYTYKGERNIKILKKRENEKRDYILYNLRKYENIRNNSLTNIPL